MYATIDDVKNFVGTQYTDAKIESMLAFTEGDVSSVVGDITYGPKTEQISVCKMYDSQIFLKNIQVKKVLSINGKEYTDDYKILDPQKRCLILCDIASYVSIGDCGSTFEIKYVSGYTEVPSDIVLAHALLTAAALSLSGKDISKYKMGPRTIEYSSTNSNNYVDKAKSILNRYRILSI